MKIWRICLDTGLLPEGTALATITPIYKGGEKSKPANYRPVTLTNHPTKIFGRVLRKAIVNHLEQHNLMNNTQHGFRSGRSTISQLCRSQFHPKPSPLDKPPGHDLKGAKTLPRDNHCVLKPSPQDKTRSQKPHPWNIKLEKFHEYIHKL